MTFSTFCVFAMVIGLYLRVELLIYRSTILFWCLFTISLHRVSIAFVIFMGGRSLSNLLAPSPPTPRSHHLKPQANQIQHSFLHSFWEGSISRRHVSSPTEAFLELFDRRKMPLEEQLSDDYVASLLAKDAKASNARYTAYGLQELLPKRCEDTLCFHIF